MPPSDTINYNREAFFHPMNLGFLFIAALSAFFLNDVGMMASFTFSVAIGIELVYLGIVPKTDFFRKAVQRRRLQEKSSSLEEKELFYTLDTKSQKRFLILKHISDQIRQNFEKMPYTSQGLTGNVKVKIQGLLGNYLMLLDSYARFEVYVKATSQAELTREISELDGEINDLTSEKLKNIKLRRRGILHKRLEKLKSAREKIQICESQLETIEDAIRYIYEQSITMSDPEQIGLQLDTLLTDVEETVTIIEDLEDDVLPGYNMISKIDELQEELAENKKTRSKVKSK